MIYIIITTSINNKNGINDSIHRQNRYIESIRPLLEFIKGDPDIKPIIVENNGFLKTYLDILNCKVCYTTNNFIELPHKGGNELLDIKEVISKYNIQDDDTIIKLTGRYKLLNSNFINFIKDNVNNYDGFVKFLNVCTKQYMVDDCVLGLFAIKCRYLKAFNYDFIRSPEVEFADYVRQNINHKKLAELEQLDLECCFADDFRILIV